MARAPYGRKPQKTPRPSRASEMATVKKVASGAVGSRRPSRA